MMLANTKNNPFDLTTYQTKYQHVHAKTRVQSVIKVVVETLLVVLRLFACIVFNFQEHVRIINFHHLFCRDLSFPSIIYVLLKYI